MSTVESIHKEYETLEASVIEAKGLLEQFPDDWTLKINIAQAEHRLEDLNNMLHTQKLGINGSVLRF